MLVGFPSCPGVLVLLFLSRGVEARGAEASFPAGPAFESRVSPAAAPPFWVWPNVTLPVRSIPPRELTSALTDDLDFESLSTKDGGAFETCDALNTDTFRISEFWNFRM